MTQNRLSKKQVKEALAENVRLGFMWALKTTVPEKRTGIFLFVHMPKLTLLGIKSWQMNKLHSSPVGRDGRGFVHTAGVHKGVFVFSAEVTPNTHFGL